MLFRRKGFFMEAKWTVYAKRADFKAIGEKYNIDQVTARIIRNRDIIEDRDIDYFLNGTLAQVHNPKDMADMDKGCRIMAEKIKQGKLIRIISDYDVDGVMSNYILYQGLRDLGAIVSYEIPDRMLDGYGINNRIIEDAYNEGIDTIITCDNGIAAYDAIELAKNYGMTVIVTDHHEVPYDIGEDGQKTYKLVPADAVIDIKREDCGYPFKGLCGAAVAYKFIRHLYDVMSILWEDENRFIEMVAIATQCDVMELVDENRIYVKKGLTLLEKTTNPGLKALIMENGLAGKKIYSYHLGFVIGPCINATGRLESAKRGLKLLLSENIDEALVLARELINLNETRKSMTNKGIEEAVGLVNCEHADDKVLVVFMPDLHESLAGIVAGKVREAFYKPVYVITKSDGGILKGSGRSIEGYHMYDALNECKDLLLKFGGHELAAGFSLEEKKLAEFRDVLNKKHKMTDEILTPKVKIDVPMPISYITRKLVNELTVLEPFGKGNEKPLFGQAGLRVKRAVRIGNEGKFLKIFFMDDSGFTIEAIDFNANRFIDYINMWFTEEDCDRMLKGMPNDIKLDVAYYPDVNDYGGQFTLQIKPLYYKKSE